MILKAAQQPQCDCCCEQTQRWEAFRPIQVALASPRLIGATTQRPLTVALGTEVPLVADAVDVDRLQIGCQKRECGTQRQPDPLGVGGDAVKPPINDPVLEEPPIQDPVSGPPPVTPPPATNALCCEKCPSTIFDRYYVPIAPNTDCEPGDVKRNDLSSKECANPLPSGWQVQPSYGPRCPERTGHQGPATIPVTGSSQPLQSDAPQQIPITGSTGNSQKTDKDKAQEIPMTGPTWFRDRRGGPQIIFQVGNQQVGRGSTQEACDPCQSKTAIALAAPVWYRWELLQGAGSLRTRTTASHTHSGVAEGAAAIYVAPTTMPADPSVTIRLMVDDNPEHVVDLDDAVEVRDISFKLVEPGQATHFPMGASGLTPQPLRPPPATDCLCQPQYEWQATSGIHPTAPPSEPMFICAGGATVLSSPANDVDSLQLRCHDAKCASPKTTLRLADALRYTWSANHNGASLLGSSDTAIFRAPDRPGLIEVTPAVSDSGLQASESGVLPTLEIRVVRMDVVRRGTAPNPDAFHVEAIGIPENQTVQVKLEKIGINRWMTLTTVNLQFGAALIYTMPEWIERLSPPAVPIAPSSIVIAPGDRLRATLVINGQALCSQEVP
ncbi:MAG: hypothetical protein HY352_01790 [Candidatus Omnitrophica bacterium]|nr:hypothetical protein [Candidatus Omnitrophota bacterium]